MPHPSLFIDALQYNNWSEEIFQQIQDGGLSAIHVTICYHEDFDEMLQNVNDWNDRFELYVDKIFLGRTASCLLYTSPSPRDKRQSRMPSSA